MRLDKDEHPLGPHAIVSRTGKHSYYADLHTGHDYTLLDGTTHRGCMEHSPGIVGFTEKGVRRKVAQWMKRQGRRDEIEREYGKQMIR